MARPLHLDENPADGVYTFSPGFKDFIFRNINCENINPEILEMVSEEKIPKKTLEKSVPILVK